MITDDFLTNDAYGFPRGAQRRIKPKVLAVVHITANMGSAQNQRDYANRAGSDGPSAHYYIDRDGDGIHAVDERKYAAWSNGDLKQPKTSNFGIKYLVALRTGGANANEGCYLEIECVGTATTFGQWTDEQFATVAQLIADASKDTGLPINADTVLPHAYINTIDRAHCPSLNVGAHMARLIALANGATPEVDVPWFPIRVPGGARAGSLAIPTGTDLFPVSGAAPIKAQQALVETDATSAIHDIDGGSAGFIFTTDITYWVRAADVGFTPTDCSAQVQAAVAKEHEDNRKAALAAVDEAIP